MVYNIEMREFAFTAQHMNRLLPGPHIHTHLEMVYIKEGRSIVTLDNKQYALEAGDIFWHFRTSFIFIKTRRS